MEYAHILLCSRGYFASARRDLIHLQAKCFRKKILNALAEVNTSVVHDIEFAGQYPKPSKFFLQWLAMEVLSYFALASNLPL